MGKRAIVWFKETIKTPWGWFGSFAAACLMMIGVFQCLDLTCSHMKSAHATMSNICITSDKVRAIAKPIADTAARVRDDSMRFDMGECISDVIIEQHRGNLMMNEVVTPAQEAKTRPVFVRDSIALVRLHQRLRMRR